MDGVWKGINSLIAVAIILVSTLSIGIFYGMWSKKYIRFFSMAIENETTVKCRNIPLSVDKITYSIINKTEKRNNFTALHDREDLTNYTLKIENPYFTIEGDVIPLTH